MKAWNLDDESNPQPNVWPECPTCSTPYAYRFAFTFSGGGTWVWTRDCKHKVPAVLMTAYGKYEEVAS